MNSTESLTVKKIFLNLLNRILNPTLESRAIGAFLFSGFVFLYFSQPFNITGTAKLNLGFLQVEASADNEPNWYLFFLGCILVAYGGYALYKLRLSPPDSRREKITQLLLTIEQKESRLANIHIQQQFLDLFKIKAPVPVIERLLSTDDPTGRIYDYRFAGYFVSLDNNNFVSVKPAINHQRQIKIYSLAYYVVSAIAFLCFAIPLAPFVDTQTREQFWGLGFPFAIAFGFVAALILNPIRAHSAALRLLASPVGDDDSPEAKKDEDTLLKLLHEIHTPTFDSFIYYGRLHFIDDDIIHFWEGYRAKINASSFHIYDEALRECVLGLYMAWGKSLSFDRYFSSVHNGRRHKFDSKYDIYRDPEAKAAHDAFTEAINDADKYLRALLTLARKKFPKIDIDKTNAAALADYRSYQLETV